MARGGTADLTGPDPEVARSGVEIEVERHAGCPDCNWGDVFDVWGGTLTRDGIS
jgi:hypothetical protein